MKNRAKATRPYIKTEPLYITELVDRHGLSSAAHMLGMSPSSLSENARASECRATFERLAEFIVLDEDCKAAMDASVAAAPVADASVTSSNIELGGIEIGSVVELNSGGAPMTVVGVYGSAPDTVDLAFFDAAGAWRELELPITALSWPSAPRLPF